MNKKMFYVAKSFQNTKLGEPYEKNGKMYVLSTDRCDRCMDGQYVIGIHNGQPVSLGECFKCNGTGYITKEVRAYTEKEYEKMKKAEEKAQELAQERENKRLKELPLKRIKWLKTQGFNEEGKTWCVLGDTFSIKDNLKQQGCKFNSMLKWHCDHKPEVDTKYPILEISAEECFTWRKEEVQGYATSNQEEAIKEKMNNFLLETINEGEFIGEEGERLRNLKATLVHIGGFEGRFGYSFVYSFDYNGNKLTWFTTKDLEMEEGTEVSLTGTVKKHDSYQGVRNTVLNRCIVK